MCHMRQDSTIVLSDKIMICSEIADGCNLSLVFVDSGFGV